MIAPPTSRGQPDNSSVILSRALMGSPSFLELRDRSEKFIELVASAATKKIADVPPAAPSSAEPAALARVVVTQDDNEPTLFYVGKKNAELRLAAKDDSGTLSREGQVLVVFLAHPEGEITISTIMGERLGAPMKNAKRQIPATVRRLTDKLKETAGRDVLERSRRGCYRWARRATTQ